MINFKKFVENMTAGDAGGSPEKIASGETSGAATRSNPEKVGKVSRKNKSSKNDSGGV